MNFPSQLRAGIATLAGSRIAVVLVDPDFIGAAKGDILLTALHPNFPHNPILLVAILQDELRGYARFQSASLLSLIQLDMIEFDLIDLGKTKEKELPF